MEVIDLPREKRLVGKGVCKWVFIVKYKADGSLERYKVRLLPKGYNQTYGVNNQETFAPMGKMNTVCGLLSFIVNLDWCL